MIKNTTIILLLNIFLFSATAIAEKAGVDEQDAAEGKAGGSIIVSKDTARSEETSAVTENSEQKESTDLPADSTSGAAEHDAIREMIAKERAAREMEARVRAARAAAAREMQSRVMAAKAEAAREMAERVRAAREEAAIEMAARVRAAREEAAIEMAARIRAAREEAAIEMAAREKERHARERYYRERMGRY